MRYRCLSFDSRPSRFHVDTACVVELLSSGALTLQDIREVSPPSTVCLYHNFMLAVTINIVNTLVNMLLFDKDQCLMLRNTSMYVFPKTAKQLVI